MQYRKSYMDYYGVKLDDTWDIHHIDYNHNNDSLDNLVALPKYLHTKLHLVYNNFQNANHYGYDLSDIRLHSGELNNHTDFMIALTNYLNVIDECTVFMNMKDFSKMRKNNE